MNNPLSDDERAVIRRVIERLYVLRADIAAGSSKAGGRCALDEALLTELADVRVERGGSVTMHEGDATWHDGPGWYYTIDDYTDEGSCGAFAARAIAEAHARQAGYTVPAEEPIYPCAHPGCTTMRTKAEGGTVFTVCDEHWRGGTR